MSPKKTLQVSSFQESLYCHIWQTVYTYACIAILYTCVYSYVFCVWHMTVHDCMYVHMYQMYMYMYVLLVLIVIVILHTCMQGPTVLFHALLKPRPPQQTATPDLPPPSTPTPPHQTPPTHTLATWPSATPSSASYVPFWTALSDTCRPLTISFNRVTSHYCLEPSPDRVPVIIRCGRKLRLIAS